MPKPPLHVTSQQAHQPGYRRLKRSALVVLLAAALVAAAVAFLLPKRQVESRNAPSSVQHRASSPAYSHPTQAH
jgi:hypothetical protein